MRSKQTIPKCNHDLFIISICSFSLQNKRLSVLVEQLSAQVQQLIEDKHSLLREIETLSAGTAEPAASALAPPVSSIASPVPATPSAAFSSGGQEQKERMAEPGVSAPQASALITVTPQGTTRPLTVAPSPAPRRMSVMPSPAFCVAREQVEQLRHELAQLQKEFESKKVRQNRIASYSEADRIIHVSIQESEAKLINGLREAKAEVESLRQSLQETEAARQAEAEKLRNIYQVFPGEFLASDMVICWLIALQENVAMLKETYQRELERYRSTNEDALQVEQRSVCRSGCRWLCEIVVSLWSGICRR